jgi:hypothetical protein
MEINILGYEIRIEYIILSIILIIFIQLNSFFSCAGGIKEGFKTLDNIGANLSFIMGNNIKGSVYDIQFSNTENSTLKKELNSIVSPYETENENENESEREKSNEINIYKDLETNIIENNNLSTNNMSFFENTLFSADCCPSNYTTSTGCACMTPEQMKFLGQRGGNRTMDNNTTERDFY